MDRKWFFLIATLVITTIIFGLIMANFKDLMNATANMSDTREKTLFLGGGQKIKLELSFSDSINPWQIQLTSAQDFNGEGVFSFGYKDSVYPYSAAFEKGKPLSFKQDWYHKKLYGEIIQKDSMSGSFTLKAKVVGSKWSRRK